MTNPNSVITVSTLAQFRTRLEQILQKLSVNINGLTANTVETALAELLTKVLNTYTQSEVNSLLNNLTRLRLVTANELPTASVETLNYVYLVPNARQGANNVKDEYITIEKRYTKGGNQYNTSYYLNYCGVALDWADNITTASPAAGDIALYRNEVSIDDSGMSTQDAMEVGELVGQSQGRSEWTGRPVKVGSYVLMNGIEYVFSPIGAQSGKAKWQVVEEHDDASAVRNVWSNYTWELLGTTEVDLSNYVTNTSLLSTLSNYTTHSELLDAVSELDNKITDNTTFITQVSDTFSTNLTAVDLRLSGELRSLETAVQTGYKPKLARVNGEWKEEGVDDYYAIVNYEQNENGEVDIAAENIPTASTSAKGLMSAADKTKLNGIEAGAQVHKAPTPAEVKTALGVTTATAPIRFLREDGTFAMPTYTINTDEKVTSAANHYTPETDSASTITPTATAGAYKLNTQYAVLTGITINRDSKGHVTNVSVTKLNVKDTNTTYENATTAKDGLMSKEDKTKLNNVVYATDSDIDSMFVAN